MAFNRQQSSDGDNQTFGDTPLRVLLCASLTKANVGAARAHPAGSHINASVITHSIKLQICQIEDKRAGLIMINLLSPQNGLPRRSKLEIVLAVQIT